MVLQAISRGARDTRVTNPSWYSSDDKVAVKLLQLDTEMGTEMVECSMTTGDFLGNSKAQEFKWLSSFSNATDSEIISAINDFVGAYGKWIEIKRGDYKKGLLTDSIAKQELDKCDGDFFRMKKNIQTFLSGDSNKSNLESFRLMNAAMFMQLWHSVKTKRDEVGSVMGDATFETFNFDYY